MSAVCLLSPSGNSDSSSGLTTSKVDLKVPEDDRMVCVMTEDELSPDDPERLKHREALWKVNTVADVLPHAPRPAHH